MKKIKIHSILSNSDNETTIVDEEVMFDEVDNVITYMEDDLKVSIYIFETFVKMRRCNEDYDLNFDNKLNISNDSIYYLSSNKKKINIHRVTFYNDKYYDEVIDSKYGRGIGTKN